MRTAVDFIGLVAYLSLMYGRLPDRRIVGAALLGETPAPPSERRAPRLTVVETDAPPPGPPIEDDTVSAAA